MSKKSCLKYCVGVGMVELLVGVVISTIVLSYVYMNFFRQSDNLGREEAKIDMQRKARLLDESLRRILEGAGEDPCRTYYWDHDYPPQNGYWYAPVHPVTTGVVHNGFSITPNIYQAVIVHSDFIQSGTIYQSDCVGSGTTITDTNGLTHYRPPRAQMIFINGLTHISNGSVFLRCTNQPDGVLLSVPVIYPDPITDPFQIQCDEAQVLMDNVECFFVDYYVTPDEGGNCGQNTVEPGGVCKLNELTYNNAKYVKSIFQLGIHIWVTAENPQRGFVHKDVRTPCNDETVFFPSGRELKNTDRPTFSKVIRAELSAIKYR